jgi:hypothetical protein
LLQRVGRNSGPVCETLGYIRLRDPSPVEQRGVTTELPRDQSMHHQLRGVVHGFLVDPNIHGFVDFLPALQGSRSPSFSKR